MPGVNSRCRPWERARLRVLAESPGRATWNADSGMPCPAALPEAQVVPVELRRRAGTKTWYEPWASTVRKGFSRTTGVRSTVVIGGLGKLWAGAPWVPTKTMFQLAPVQLPKVSLRDSHCCCEPD